ncbi:hypothetical protein KC660_01335 [Candidatus Dojkabacteria bacterium]|uniref:DUF2268 domain-containing protein n=1 Tax=Candidatus Dojkabacteria bacterium TaxID=2099670 RepID=A0A955RHP8_9BACT|nr:hypothetical protein [Candidatus Dojkabacteria bacterium]
MVTGAEQQKTGGERRLSINRLAKPALLLLAGLTLAASVHFASPAQVSAYQGEVSGNSVIAENVGVRADFDSSLSQAEIMTLAEIKEKLESQYGVIAMDSQKIDGEVWGSDGDIPLFLLEQGMTASSWRYQELQHILKLYETGLMPKFEREFYLVRAVSNDESSAYLTNLDDDAHAIVYGVSSESSFDYINLFGEDIYAIDFVFLHEITHMALGLNPKSYAEFMDIMRELGTEWMDYDILTGLPSVYRNDLHTKKIYIQFTQEEADQFRRNDQGFQIRLRDLKRDGWNVADVSNLGYPPRPAGSIYLTMRPGANNYLPTDYSLSSPREALAETGALMLYQLVRNYRGQTPEACLGILEEIEEKDVVACGFYRYYCDLFYGVSISMN